MDVRCLTSNNRTLSAFLDIAKLAILRASSFEEIWDVRFLDVINTEAES